jgi:hypothetical protein
MDMGSISPYFFNYSILFMTPLTEEALKTAISQVGVKEDPLGSNAGPKVNEYLASVHLPPGNFWCAAFVYWCFQQAANKAGVHNPLFQTGSVLKQWSASSLNRSYTPDPGDILILDYGGGHGHMTLIENVDGENLHTIEGNGSTDGSRNGTEVVRHIRHIRDAKVKGFLRF